MFSTVDQLSEFSLAVRTSTIKRLQKVPAGKENWRITPQMMSFAEIAKHLVRADDWLYRKIELKTLSPIKGNAGSIIVETRNEYLELVNELDNSGNKRSDFICSLDEMKLQEKMFDERFDKEVNIWWIIVRGNLDHEIHHRGQISAYLRVMELENKSL
jgi:uncharacterized damage-inducible protein DinB